MKKVAVIFADGVEEIEGISVVDILRRGEIETVIVGLDKNTIIGSHGIKINTDITLYDLRVGEFDMLVLPGGQLGVSNISENLKMREIIKQFDKNSKFVAAICAAPIALDIVGVIKGNFTCYPSCESVIQSGSYVSNSNVVVSGNIITSRGPATAIEFGLCLVRLLRGDEKYKEVCAGLLFEK